MMPLCSKNGRQHTQIRKKRKHQTESPAAKKSKGPNEQQGCEVVPGTPDFLPGAENRTR